MIVAAFPKLKRDILENLKIRSATQIDAVKMVIVIVFFAKSGLWRPTVTKMSMNISM